jgi:protein-disulfide isomerase
VGSGVNAASFDRCYKAKTYAKAIEQDLSDGIVLGVRGTPTYMVNGQFFEGVATLEQWKKIILDALNQP